MEREASAGVNLFPAGYAPFPTRAAPPASSSFKLSFGALPDCQRSRREGLTCLQSSFASDCGREAACGATWTSAFVGEGQPPTGSSLLGLTNPRFLGIGS